MNQNTQQAVDRVEHFAKTWRWQRDKQDIADVQDGPDTCVVLAIADLDVLISERKKPIANLERTESERDTARALLSQEYGRLRPALDYLQQHHAQFDATAGQRFTSIIGEWFPKLAERAKRAEEATQAIPSDAAQAPTPPTAPARRYSWIPTGMKHDPEGSFVIASDAGCVSASTPAAPAQSGEPVAWTADSLYDAIEKSLLLHKLSNWQDQYENQLGLVDRLCDDNAHDISSGQHAIRLICDEIYNEVLTVAAPQPQPTSAVAMDEREAIPLAWQSNFDGLLAYVLQDDLHNRLTPRVIDIAYTAFMNRATGKNKEDGGPCDWFNDTRPVIQSAILKLSKDLSEARAASQQATATQPEQVERTLTEDRKQLMSFYAVDTPEKLVEAMERHIEKLQSKLPQARDTFPRTPREG